MTPLQPFFHGSRIAQLSAVANSWLGTPFHPNGRVKGAAVSCQTLVGLILQECRFPITDAEIKSGPMDWHWTESPIETGFDAMTDRVANILGTAVRGGDTAEGCTADPLPFMAGDIVGFRVGQCIKHCGLMLSDHEFIHVLRHSRACVLEINDATWISRLERAWRPLA